MIAAKVIDLPHDIHGLTTIADDGSYIILLNARDSRERNRQSYLHELKHIEHGDLYCAESLRWVVESGAAWAETPRTGFARELGITIPRSPGVRQVKLLRPASSPRFAIALANRSEVW